jgi:hypothetical protein
MGRCKLVYLKSEQVAHVRVRDCVPVEYHMNQVSPLGFRVDGWADRYLRI